MRMSVRAGYAWISAAVLFSACASAGSLAAHSPTTPRLAQTAAQHDTDSAACARQANDGSGRESIDMLYQACMVSRGYKTAVGVGASVFMEVDAGTALRPYDTVLTDLRSCLGSKPQVSGGTIALAALFGASVLAPEAEKAIESFTSCMTPRAYSISRWTR